MRRFGGTFAVVVLSLTFAAPTPSVAGSIGIVTEVSAAIEGGFLAVAVRLTNKGDEPAHTVGPAVQFGSHEARGDVRAVLPPSDSMTMNARIPVDVAVGQWPLVTRIDYADVNGHPFQAMHVAVVSSPSSSPALVAVVDVNAHVAGTSGGVQTHLKGLSEAAQQLRLRFLVPRGLEVAPAEVSLALEAWGDAVADATIANRAALAGSRYPVFVVAEYNEDGVPHAALGSAVVEIRGADSEHGRGLLVGAAALIGAWIVVVVRLRRRRPPGTSAALRAPEVPPGPDSPAA
jgi:hypothetical protein